MNQLLTQLPGIGPASAPAIEKLLPAGTPPQITAIRAALRAKSLFSQLPVATQADLTYNPIKRIPRALISAIDSQISRLSVASESKFTIAGSFRREKPFSGDLDIVILKGHWSNLAAQVNRYSAEIEILPPFAGKDSKLSVMLRVRVPAAAMGDVVANLESYHLASRIKSSKSVYVKADVFVSPPGEFVTHLLFATGSGNFNVAMRKRAKSAGMLLNQHGLFDKLSGKKIRVRTERGVFKKLRMTWREPAERSQ
jgi:DNA polymerase/3'-5' exonuclease PolX